MYKDRILWIVDKDCESSKETKAYGCNAETLSIIAYKQPVTKQEIEAIRGVKCDHPINKLLEYRLIKEAGRLDAIGRPILFRTTEEFLRCFGVKSTDDLPVVGEEQVEDFKIQAQEEVKYTLDETNLEEEMEEM